MAAKLCPFKKNHSIRVLSEEETVDEIDFGICDGKSCMAYNVYDTINCALIRRET